MKVSLYYFLCEIRTGSLHKEWLFYCVPALPQLGRLTAGLSPGMPGFHPRAVHVRCMVDEVAMGQNSVSTSVFRCLYHSTIAPYLSSSTCYFIRRAKERRLEYSFGNQGEHGYKGSFAFSHVPHHGSWHGMSPRM